MDIKAIQADIRNHKIRGGYLYKRSKFLKEWRMRWVVVTTNFMYTFTDQKMAEVTDVIDLKDVKSYKSYLRKDEEMIPPGFKLRSADDMLYFCAKNCHQKWSWLVTLERLMDFKYIGASSYNNVDWVRTRGFESQIDFEKGGTVVDVVMPPQQKIKSSEEAKKEVDDEADKILKQLQEQQKQLEKRKEELQKKQATFIEQQKKAQEQKLRKKQQEQEQKKAQQPPPPAPKKQQPQKPVQQPKQDSGQKSESRVAQMKNLFQTKSAENKDTMPKYDSSKYAPKKVERKQDDIHLYRQKVVSCLFEEFRKQAEHSFGLKPVVDFLVDAAGNEKMGYSPFVIIEGKSHNNRLIFAEIFIELLNVFENYEKCENLMKFIEICIFQIPGLFTSQQTGVIQRKLKDIFLHTDNEQNLAMIIKNMFIMHKMQGYDKNQIHPKLDKLVKDVKVEETRNWARKLRDAL